MKVDLEKCISCGRETGYSINDHVDSRKTYVDGAGQLCADIVSRKFIIKVHKKDVDTDEKP
jgi:hypothetical protein